MIMQTAAEVQAHVLLKVSDDVAFRERLAQDPKTVIEEETGRAVPDDVLVFIKKAVVNAQDLEKSRNAAPLTREELNQVVGGGSDEEAFEDWIEATN